MEKTIKLDNEWIELIKKARDYGFTKEEITALLKDPELLITENFSSKEN